MATSGSFSGSIRDGKYKLRVDWSATQSVTNNTSKITAVMYLVQGAYASLNIDSRSDNTTVIAGTSHTWSSPAFNNSGSKTTKMATVTSGNIAHNADGTKSVTIKATYYIRFSSASTGAYYEKIEASETVTLDTIPRATTPKLSATNVFMGDSVTISLDRASSSFTHDLAYQFAGGSWVSIKTGVGTSYAWAVPDLATSIPNASSGTITVRCITKNGSTTIGTKTVSMTAKVPTSAAYQPTISAVNITEGTAGMAAQFDAFIQNKSKVKAAITSAGAKGSTIEKVSTTFQGKTYTGSSWTSDILTASGSLSMTTKVTDSRGRTASKTTNFSVLAYSTPRVTEFDAYRVNADGDQDTEGQYALIAYAYSVPSLNGGNTAALTIQYKPSAESEWENLLTGSALTANTTHTTGAIFSSDIQYDLRLVIKDYFGAQSIYPATLPSGAVIVDILADGTGLGIGKVAELSGVCDIAMQTRLQGGQLHVVLKEGVDLNDCKTPGHYVGASGVAVPYGNNPFENGVTFDLEVVTAGLAGQTRQTITECKKDGSRILHRFFYGSSWSKWSNTWYELADGTDLNALLEAGTYRLPSASTYDNAPEEGVGAMLEVMGLGTIIQRWTTASKTNPRTYERSYYGDAWGDWMRTHDAQVGKVYSVSKSVQITTADIDKLQEGATLEVPAGTYVVIATAVFNTGSSTGTRNNQIRLLADSTAIARERVFAAGANYAEMQTSAIHVATAKTTFTVQKSSSITENSTAATTIKAIKIS